MGEAKDLELEISTEGARSLLEIGCDVGINSAANFGVMSGALDEAAAEFMIKNAANPFRRASTEIIEPVSPVLKQLERVEADAEANARAQAQASAEHYTEVARAHTQPTPRDAPQVQPARPHVMCWGTYWTQDGNEPCSLRAGHDGAHR